MNDQTRDGMGVFLPYSENSVLGERGKETQDSEVRDPDLSPGPTTH